MTASTMASNLLSSDILVACPATAALEQAQRKMSVAREEGASFESKISCGLYNLTFEHDSVDSFPVIEWDSNEDSDSDSVRSMDTWNSIFADFGSSGSLGKRSRGESNRRLVRSKKIKSDLASLAISFSARSA